MARNVSGWEIVDSDSPDYNSNLKPSNAESHTNGNLSLNANADNSQVKTSWIQSHGKQLLAVAIALLVIGLTAYVLFGKKTKKSQKCGLLDTTQRDSYSLSGDVRLEGQSRMRFLSPPPTANVSSTPSLLLWHTLLPLSWECTFTLHNHGGVGSISEEEEVINRSFCFFICGHPRGSTGPMTFLPERMLTMSIRDDHGKKAKQIKIRCHKHILRLWLDGTITPEIYTLCPKMQYTCGLGGHFWNKDYDYQVEDFCLLESMIPISDDFEEGDRPLLCSGRTETLADM